MQRSGVQRLACGLVCTCVGFMLGVLPAFAQDGAHVVQPGENLFRISLRYGVDVDTLAQVNGIPNSWQIYAGQSLTIPGAVSVSAPAVDPASQPAPVEAAAAAPGTTHTVQRGENLASIASQYGMTPQQLAQLNNILNPNLIYSGQQLVIAAGTAPVEPAAPAPIEVIAEAAPAATASTTHVVQGGQHLASIAAQYGVSVLAIAQANNIVNTNHIEVGQTLIIPGADAVGSEDYGIVSLPAAPAAAVAAGRSIVVDLSDSRIYAYEDGALVRNVLASTGLPGTPTVQGDFAVYVKYPAQLMAGPGYYLPDVPYVMYFYEGYGIHGTYWHNNFGVPMSHGCVNLPTHEAEWFYNWASVGTPVHVQY